MQIFKLVTLLSILSAVSVTVRGDVTYEIIQKWKKAHNPTTEDSQNPKTKKPTPVTTPVPVIKLAPTKPKTERSTQKKTRINPDQSNIENDWLSWFWELVQGLVTTTRVINVVVTLLLVKLTSLYMGRSQTERRQKPQRNSKVQPTSNDYNVYPDASDRHIGGVILKNGKIMGSHNRKLRGNEKKLSNGEKELLSIVEILQENRSMVKRRKLVVHTNHMDLLYQGSSRSKAIMEWRCTLEEYQIRYKGYNTPTKPTLDPQASKKSPPGASLNEIAPVGSDEHPGLNAFYRWCKAEASLYRSYTFVPKDPSVITVPPPQAPWGEIRINLTVKNLTNREINVFYINIGRDENYVLAGTIPSKGIWTGRGFNNYRWVFEDALTAKTVLYYVPHKNIPSIPGHQFILVPPGLTSDNDCNHIGVVDAVLPFSFSIYLDQPIDAINWTLEHLSRCCKASSRHNSMLAEANTCQKYLSNIINHPENWKYRNLRIEEDRFNPIWKSPLRGLLLAVGFVKDRGFCRLGRSDSPLPSDRIKDISMLSFLLAEWIWRLKKAMGHKTKFEFEWNHTTPQPNLSNTEALGMALYQSKIAAIEQQAESKLDEKASSGVVADEMLYHRELEAVVHKSELKAAPHESELKAAPHKSELTADQKTLLQPNLSNTEALRMALYQSKIAAIEQQAESKLKKAASGVVADEMLYHRELEAAMHKSELEAAVHKSELKATLHKSWLKADQKTLLQPNLSNTEALGMALYQSKIAAIEQQAESKLKKAARGMVADEMLYHRELEAAVHKSELEAALRKSDLEAALHKSELTADQKALLQPFLSNAEALGRAFVSKLAAIEQQAESERPKKAASGVAAEELLCRRVSEAAHQSDFTAALKTLLGGCDPTNNDTPRGAVDAGVTGLDEIPNGMTTLPEETASSSSHSPLPSSEESLSSLNATPFESNSVEPISSDGASPDPLESNNSVSAEGIPADGTLSSGSKVEPKRRRLNPSLASDPERRRQLEARLQALEKGPKASTQKKAKKSRPLSSPYTNMMKWSQG